MREPPGERATPRGPTLADLLERVRWDYDPKRADTASPLVTTERFFRDFPWQGRDEGAS